MSKPGSAQSQREFTLNRQKPADFAKLPADVQYLLDDKTEIGHTISEGLNVLYRVQPRHPIDYLAKWLLNHEATKLHKGTVHQDEQKAAEIVKKYDELAKEKQKEQDKRDAARMLHDKFENIFRDKIKNHEYHEELLNNELPSFIEKQQEIPAIYIGMLEHPSRAVGDEDDDEYAHLDKTATPLITYVGASGTQKFVIGRELPLVPESVTYAVFQPKEEEPPAEVAEGEEAPVNTKPNYLYIPDVTKEPRMVYFRIPRLGAYLACPLIYKSVLNEKSFDEGCAERLRVQEEIEKQKKDKEERDEQFQAKIQEAQAAGTETEEIEAEWKGFEWPVIEEKPFEYEERKFVLCVDTLGQDRELTEEERAYVSKLAQEFVQCWEESERRQLSRDIDTFLEAQKSVNKEEFIEATTKKLNEELAEKFQEEPEESELRQNARKAAIAAEYYRNRLAEEDVKKMIKGLASYRVIKYKPLIQSVLYFLGYKKGQINVPGTNLLDWKEVKKIISRDDFFTKLDEYEFKGPKEGYWERYALTDKLAPKFEKYNVEEIDQYNLGLGILYRYVKQVLDARLLDIQMRRTQKNDLRTKRDEVLKEVEAQKERHDNELAEAQAKAAEAEEAEEEFNKEEWEAKWLEANPPITVPEEVTDELDEDITPENVETA